MSTVIYNHQKRPADIPCIDVNDRGFTLGHGIFETILIKHNTTPALDYHWERLETSAPLVGISLPFSFSELREMLQELIKENQLEEKMAGARVTITHGSGARGLFPSEILKPNFLIHVFEYHPPKQETFSLTIVETRKNEASLSSRVKSISYLDNILAKREAETKGFDEALLLNSKGYVADTSLANIFMVKNEKIFTPFVSDGALPGVTRAILLKNFKLFPIIETSLTLPELLNADEIFITNALIGVKSIGKIETRTLTTYSTAQQITSFLATFFA